MPKDNHTHSVVLMRRNDRGGWDYVKYNSMSIVIDRLTLDQIAWMNTACKADWKWASND